MERHSYSQIGRQIVKMATHPKVIYKFNVNSIKSTAAFYAEQPDPRIRIEMEGTQNSQNNWGGGVSTQKRQGMWPHASAPRDWREEAGTKGLGRGAGHLISRCEAPLWVPVQEQCWGL